MQRIEEATKSLETTARTQPAPLKKTRSLQPRSLESAPAEEKLAARKIARRSLVTRDAIVAQRDANAVMLDTLAKYKMNAEVTLSREGQMVIQVAGAGPTLFTPEDAKDPSLSFLAIDEGKGCPDPNDLEAIEADPILATNCFVDDLRASGQFEYVEKDFIFENQFVRRPPEGSPSTSDGVTPSTGSTPVSLEVTPNDPLWDLQWDMKPRGSGEGQSLGGAGFQDFWTRQGIEGSSDVVVAVVDTGLQMNHPDIAASANIAPGWDMVSDPRMGNDGDGRDSDPNDPGDLCNPAVPGSADSFHGTHVAGTIGAAASNNGAGVAGGAWNVKIVPVRALGKCGGRLSDINDSIRWAAGLIPAEGEDGSEVWNDNPADIINLSIGLFEYCPASLQDAIDSVTERGAVVVSAAGNARIDTAYYAPGGCDNVISVAAGNALGEITAYSNFGDGVDILAPGGEMARDDDNDSRPDGILSTKASTDCYDPLTGEAVQDCYYAYEQGTSMAAPHVSAALALLKARDPEASSDELVDTLLAATDPRTDMQCSGLCADYPGTTPIPGSENMCRRPCGGRILNLANVPELGGTVRRWRLNERRPASPASWRPARACRPCHAGRCNGHLRHGRIRRPGPCPAARNFANQQGRAGEACAGAAPGRPAADGPAGGDSGLCGNKPAGRDEARPDQPGRIGNHLYRPHQGRTGDRRDLPQFQTRPRRRRHCLGQPPVALSGPAGFPPGRRQLFGRDPARLPPAARP